MSLCGSRGKLTYVAEEAASGALLLFGGGTLATLLSAVCSIIVARLLGPELYGVYSLSLIVSNFLMVFTDFGVGPALTRYVAYYNSRGESSRVLSLMSTGLSFSFTEALIVLLVGLTLADKLTVVLLNRPELSTLVSITLPLILFHSFSIAASYSLLGFNDMRSYVAVDILRQASRAILTPLLIILGFGVLGAVTGYVTAYMLSFLVGTLFIFRHYKMLNTNRSWKGDSFIGNLKMMMNYGMPLYTSSILHSSLATLRDVILAYFTTNFMIGNFHIAMNLATLVTLLSTPIATTLFPTFSRLSENSEDLRKMFKYAVRYTSALIVPASIFVAFMSRELTFIVYGSSYIFAPSYLTLYVLSFLYAGVGSIVLPSLFNGVGGTDINLKATLVYYGVFIPSAVALTLVFKVEGLLISILISTGVSVLYSLKAAAKRYGISPDLKTPARIYASSTISMAPLIPLVLYLQLPYQVNFVVGAILYTLTYLTVAPIFKAINEEDIQNLTRIFVKIKPLKPMVKVLANYERRILKLWV